MPPPAPTIAQSTPPISHENMNDLKASVPACATTNTAAVTTNDSTDIDSFPVLDKAECERLFGASVPDVYGEEDREEMFNFFAHQG